MTQRTLGTQGLEVPAIGLGCMGMSEFYGDSSQTNNLKVLDKALELGCNFWDTADMYGPFSNERLLGQALKGRRQEVTLASKFGIARNEAGEFLGVNGRPDYVKTCCEASLKRLGTDHIDLYYQHRVDPNVPIEDTVGAMGDLVSEGKVKYLGLSEADTDTIRRAHNTHPISVLQTEYSLWSRDIEQTVLPLTRSLNIGFVAYSPLGRGFLTGQIQHPTQLDAGDWRLDNPRFQSDAMTHNAELVNAISQHAQMLGYSASSIAIAWVLAQGEDIATIPGTRHIDRLQQNWDARHLELPETIIDTLTHTASRFVVQGERY